MNGTLTFANHAPHLVRFEFSRMLIKESTFMGDLLYYIIIGLAAGWLAGKIMRGSGFGLVGNLIVGVLGAMLGAFIFQFIGISAGGLIGSLVMAVVGAVVLLYLLQLLKRL